MRETRDGSIPPPTQFTQTMFSGCRIQPEKLAYSSHWSEKSWNAQVIFPLGAHMVVWGGACNLNYYVGGDAAAVRVTFCPLSVVARVVVYAAAYVGRTKSSNSRRGALRVPGLPPPSAL